MVNVVAMDEGGVDDEIYSWDDAYFELELGGDHPVVAPPPHDIFEFRFSISAAAAAAPILDLNSPTPTQITACNTWKAVDDAAGKTMVVNRRKSMVMKLMVKVRRSIISIRGSATMMPSFHRWFSNLHHRMLTINGGALHSSSSSRTRRSKISAAAASSSSNSSPTSIISSPPPHHASLLSAAIAHCNKSSAAITNHQFSFKL